MKKFFSEIKFCGENILADSLNREYLATDESTKSLSTKINPHLKIDKISFFFYFDVLFKNIYMDGTLGPSCIYSKEHNCDYEKLSIIYTDITL